VHEVSGRLVFTDKDGVDWRLISEPSPPGATGPAGGRFHPFDLHMVARALNEIQYPLERLHVEVFLLPYPREELPGCSSDGDAIYLSPAGSEVPERYVRFVVAHEIGHCVARRFMPYEDFRLWQEYRSLRGITDPAIYYAAAPHANRPFEIFAEDFRWLFSPGPHRVPPENSRLPTPDEVRGLREFFLALCRSSHLPVAELTKQLGQAAPCGTAVQRKQVAG